MAYLSSFNSQQWKWKQWKVLFLFICDATILDCEVRVVGLLQLSKEAFQLKMRTVNSEILTFLSSCLRCLLSEDLGPRIMCYFQFIHQKLFNKLHFSDIQISEM